MLKAEDSSRKCRGWFPRVIETTPKKPYQVCSLDDTVYNMIFLFHFFVTPPSILAVCEHMGSEGVPGA